MIDFSQVTEILLGNTPVEQVTDSQGNVMWSASVDPSTVYFYVEDISGQSNTVSIKKGNNYAPTITVYKSTDGTNWNSMGNTSTTGINATIPANSRLYLKATVNSWCSSSYYNYITTSKAHNVGGNIMSLLYGDNFQNQTTFPSGSTYNFRYLFEQNTLLKSAGDLVLPATTLTKYCYLSMFYNCTSLTTAPSILPATKLVDNCYQYMFQGCTSLTTAPALPATTLAISCYDTMFKGCTSLTTAPALPATTLVQNCYYSMFQGCTSLTTPPALPATTLAISCYNTMFKGCTNLNEVTTYAQNISASQCLYYWLNNVAATGDFYNLGGATYTSGPSGIPSGWTKHTSL